MATLTPKQESFCLKYIETGNASEAYRQSYEAGGMKSETINRNAKALLDNNKISTRIKHLQAEHRQRHDVTVDSLTAELEAARLLAMKEGNPSAAVSACMGKAKLHGLLTDRQELTGKDGRPIDFPDAKAALLRGIAASEEQVTEEDESIINRYVQHRVQQEIKAQTH